MMSRSGFFPLPLSQNVLMLPPSIKPSSSLRGSKATRAEAHAQWEAKFVGTLGGNCVSERTGDCT